VKKKKEMEDPKKFKRMSKRGGKLRGRKAGRY